MYKEQYDTLLNLSLQKYFIMERIEEIKSYNDLYKINVDFNDNEE